MHEPHPGGGARPVRRAGRRLGARERRLEEQRWRKARRGPSFTPLSPSRLRRRLLFLRLSVLLALLLPLLAAGARRAPGLSRAISRRADAADHRPRLLPEPR